MKTVVISAKCGEVIIFDLQISLKTTNFPSKYVVPRVVPLNEKFSSLMVSSGGGMVTSEGDTCITPCISSKHITLTI